MTTRFSGKFDVILTDEAIELLSTPPFACNYLFHEKGYIEAEEINPSDSYYFHLIVRGNTEAGEFQRELLLPHHYIRYVISAQPQRIPGFGKT